MKILCCVPLLPLLSVSACSQAVPQGQPSAPPVQVAAMVDHLYKEVVARHPLSIPNRKIFGPYLSRGLLHSFDVDNACFDRWNRANPDPNLKPAVGLIEFGFFSGGSEEAEPQAFHIEKLETEKDGSYRAHVKLTYTDASDKLNWNVVAVVITENGRLVVDDVIYLKQEDRDETRLSEILKQDCERAPR